ncbi:hypothetical protein CDL12_15362 [Handroanthus impetiginosus]|uniref:Uncharacterized protein n=1 Tax=Handroanthus impetiginosus TaxID=429701 RepID=A0A2G9H3B8_9LAMI|nr:hypothetical protein CDL12_15362 [Handroanthus impetiginosus]
MPEFGDEFIIESYKVPWLIWIQLLVMILLILLLFFGFSIFSSDPSSSSFAAPSSTTAAPPTHLNKPSPSRRRTRVEDQRNGRDEETRGQSVQEEDQSGEESPVKDSIFFRIFRHPNHPCDYFGQAKRALLKCFGLDPGSEISSRHRHKKQE